ncbi:PLP-dependent aminotransferase family protein [Yersinia massiliensis]|uniref:PLP-dependent aminotransferase family protein n=1 Tax=Yersinia massiliensis TaxID=419257 RepID=A0AA90Y064_9GAMM|nr:MULTISPECIES: PLP-dependent aminotransferase family protein [Yersinia]HEC1648226.1 PLP-dependent aminotransferase family protein [Yersinia enterocolitica]ATM87956.1 PLP-dependent aminotransferase family protein [Yersinia frederiksenii]MCB5318751.1 PLP-dependent aminotransferase family protein [Yersinia massiliensis]MDA5548000.1 PLP-dependent aminotransferase family protein [Yersinia massiliensis]NIL27888.1 PLP-dependent aminotransferase family protein [Yersinia massiliensis]
MSLVMNEIRYLQVAATLAQAIEKGSLLAGSRLPSVRSYAKNLQVSINTVVAAYRTLEDRGLIEARPQSGFYVCSPSTAVVPTATVGKPVDEVLDLIDTVFAAQQNTRFTNISLACPQTGDFYPSAKLGRIMASLLRREPQLISQYALPPGSQRLRQQIARRAMTLGMLANPADITITHGCMEALQLALRVTTKPGDCVGLESPTYFYLMPLLASLGLKAVEIPTDSQQGLSLDVLELLLKEGRLNALIAMPTVQNPMGFTMPLAAKKRLAQLMNDHQVPLIEDGLYAEIQFGSTLSPAVKAFDRDGWILFCSSFTKTLAPDFRVGWIDGGRFTEDLHKLKAVSSMAESTLLSETLALFLKSGGYDHHLRSLRRRYAQQVQQAQQLITRHFPYGTKVTQPAGGFVFWVEFPDSVDTVALFHQMLKEQICLTPGTLYSPSGRYRHAFRLSCCYPFNQRYTEALARLGAVACDISGLPAGMRWPSLEADTMERPVF